jgi:hypothetical protein
MVMFLNIGTPEIEKAHVNGLVKNAMFFCGHCPRDSGQAGFL